MNISFIKDTITSNAGRVLLVTKKISPDILTGVGIAGVVVAGVLACRATLNLEPVVDMAQTSLDEFRGLRDRRKKAEDPKADSGYAKDVIKVYSATAFELTKLYGPSIFIGGASIACLVGSHTIMRRRNAGLMAAYKVLDEGFKRYRSRVVEEYGDETDKDFAGGIRSKMVTREDEAGHKEIVDISDYDPSVFPSAYARFFDESCSLWAKNPEHNMMTLKCLQDHYNRQLRVKGYVFLNDVYDALGIPRSQAGQLVGWIYNPKRPDIDNYIDFGIYNHENARSRDFVNGWERSILLDFNVDGVIYDLI